MITKEDSKSACHQIYSQLLDSGNSIKIFIVLDVACDESKQSFEITRSFIDRLLPYYEVTSYIILRSSACTNKHNLSSYLTAEDAFTRYSVVIDSNDSFVKMNNLPPTLSILTILCDKNDTILMAEDVSNCPNARTHFFDLVYSHAKSIIFDLPLPCPP